jgi:formylglycine-generating enzyme required for sulfatase activity
MKEPVNIDLLFQKASTTPVNTSFDTAKDTFTQSLAQRGKGGKTFLRLTKWILMITIIISGITALTLTLYPGQKPEKAPSKEPIEQTQAPNTVQKKEVLSVTRESTEPNSNRIEIKQEMMTLPIPVFTHYLLASPKAILEPSSLLYDFAFDRREKREKVDVPILTEDAISDNDKRKKKMMKALAKQDNDHYAYIPSGSSKYKGKSVSVQSFFMQVNEVSNVEYRTFLNDLLIQGKKEEYQKAYPQEEQWTKLIDGEVLAMESMYFTHPAFDDFPVVNVTREGAEMFCFWLTLETSKSKYVDDQMALNDLRLPQRMEWTYAASGGNESYAYPWGGPYTQNDKDCYLANYKPDSTHYADDGAFFTAKTETYHHNDFGLYNMSGNVAEMVYGSTDITSDSDLISVQTAAGTAGGGWMDDAEALKIEGDDPYAELTDGHPNIGFRVVMTHIGRKPLVGQQGK